MSSERVEQALERLSEDSSLTDELDDQTATVLLQWAEQQVKAADELDDPAFEARVIAVRSAARTAARPTTRSGDPDPADVIVKRAAELLAASLTASTTVAPEVAQPPTNALPTMVESSVERSAPNLDTVVQTSQPVVSTPPSPTTPRSPWQLLRRRIRRWTHRKA